MSATTAAPPDAGRRAVFYLLLGLFLTGRFGLLWQQAVGLALLLAVAGRFFIIGTTFAFSRAHAVTPPAGCRIGALRGIALYAARGGSLLRLLFTLIMPFERLFMACRPHRPQRGRAAAAAAGPRLPVQPRLLARTARPLERAGWQVGTISLAPVFNDIDGYVEQVARRIDEVCAAAGTEQLILVGHSMGGLVSRAYLRRHGNGPRGEAGDARLAAPRQQAGGDGAGRATARQMVPGSDWLAGLNAPGAVPLPAATVSIYSCQDNYVMPQDSSLLEGAKVVPLAGLGHLEMAFSPEIDAAGGCCWRSWRQINLPSSPRKRGSRASGFPLSRE
jgi:predicted alpha/beta hydrolase family esterase